MAIIKRTIKERTPRYEQIIGVDDQKINVLILGTSGCGKSTLINAILEANEAPTGAGDAVTKEIAIYQNDELPFRMIDTVGFEYGLMKQLRIKKDIAKFCKEGVKSADVEKLIHMIWFCVDGTAKRIDQEMFGYIRSVTDDWKNVPVIVVFTKSYSQIEIAENIAIAKTAITRFNLKNRRKPLNVKAIVPVVAKEFRISETISVPPKGLDALVTKTIELAPEAKKTSIVTVQDLDLKMKNTMANTMIGGAAAGAAAVGAIPLPLPDAAILVPIQSGLLSGISNIYGIRDMDTANVMVNKILEVGATTMAGRALLNALKAIPGLNGAASVLNAAVAGSITLAAGEIANVLFQKAYTGEIELNSVDWNNEINRMFNDYLPGIIEALRKITEGKDGKIDARAVGEAMAIIAKTVLKKKL